MTLLSCEPHRLGHATFLDDQAKELVLARGTCIEICLTSNILCAFAPTRIEQWTLTSDIVRCKTVGRLEDHHIRYYLERNHPIAVCVRIAHSVWSFSAYSVDLHRRTTSYHSVTRSWLNTLC